MVLFARAVVLNLIMGLAMKGVVGGDGHARGLGCGGVCEGGGKGGDKGILG